MDQMFKRISIIIAIIFVIELIGYVSITYFGAYKFFDKIQGTIDQKNQPSKALDAQSATDIQPKPAPKDIKEIENNVKLDSLQKYTNDKYSYEISYPQDWESIKEYSIVDVTNKLLSIKEFSNIDKSNKVKVYVNEREWLLKYEAPQKNEVIINGAVFTAYVFPQGYECHDQTSDCSFFVIPIFKNGLWYEIRGHGRADQIYSVYKDIFSTFRFTDGW